MQNNSRRSFLKQTLATAAGLATARAASLRAMEPLVRSGPARLPLSLAAYSFRDDFKRPRPDEKRKQLDLFQFIDYCADHGLSGTELTSYYFPANLDNEFLLRIRRHAFLRGIAISGTAVGNVFTHPRGEKRDEQIRHVKQWIDHASVMGAPHIRIFAGNPQPGTPMDTSKRIAIETIEECCDYAGQNGIFLGLENHGGIVAEPQDLLDIVAAVQSPWFGVNLDTGNFHTADPYADLERCAPYAVNVQIKVEVQPRGAQKQRADLTRFIKMLRAVRYQGFVALEYEAAPSPWEAIPPLLEELKTLVKTV